MAGWALIVQPLDETDSDGFFGGPLKRLFLIAIPLVLLMTWAVFNRANRSVALQMEADRSRIQLEHAAKLASVGELAAGIAHEINNPLAVINEEAGLIKDLMNPELGKVSPPEELIPHLDSIERSVFRCRDITHKLLGFVRKSEVELKSHDLGKIIDGVVDGFLGKKAEVSNVKIIREYDEAASTIGTDANQLRQVLLNLINNAIDALEEKPGKITIKTFVRAGQICIAISDTGKGITSEQLGKIFLPFYTTKEVGGGTGLGLSVSYGIVTNLGGDIEVMSRVGQGSTFTIVLPKS
jgi:two-component system NtrC family sensor kinase